MKVLIECNECGKKFQRSEASLNLECPRCHGVDVDPIALVLRKEAHA